MRRIVPVPDGIQPHAADAPDDGQIGVVLPDSALEERAVVDIFSDHRLDLRTVIAEHEANDDVDLGLGAALALRLGHQKRIHSGKLHEKYLVAHKPILRHECETGQATHAGFFLQYEMQWSSTYQCR